VPILAACLAACLGACGGGSGGSEAPVDPATLPASLLSCAANASATTPVGRLHNNTWNSQAIGNRPWQQCLQQRGQGAVAQYGWQWQWPEGSSQVLAYPSVVMGAKPWESGPGNDARLPRQISAMRSLVLDFDVELTGTGSFNLMASMWLIRTPQVARPADERAISGEILVMTSAQGGDWASGGNALGSVNIGGRTWTVSHSPDWADISGGSNHRWPLVAYVATSNTTQARLDLRQFLADAVARGLVDPAHHVADVELGNEIARGVGSTWIRALSLTVE
jgi:cellulose 1,4-beta-cellobiosidase